MSLPVDSDPPILRAALLVWRARFGRWVFGGLGSVESAAAALAAPGVAGAAARLQPSLF